MKLFKYLFIGAFILLSQVINAQIGTNVPRPDNTPVDFSRIENIIIYIVLPILIVVLYFVYRKRKKKEAEQAAEQEAKQNKNKTNTEL